MCRNVVLFCDQVISWFAFEGLHIRLNLSRVLDRNILGMIMCSCMKRQVDVEFGVGVAGMALIDPSGWAPSPRTPLPTSRVSTLATTAGTPPDSPPTPRPSPATASWRSSTRAGPCSAPWGS